MTALAVTAVLAVIPATVASPLTLDDRRTECRFATADGHVRRFLDLRPSVWNARSNVVIALARARGGWSPWACA